MTGETLRSFRTARGLSQRTAALSWAVDSHTVYRWEAGLRPIPMWLERMIELLKKIESQEKEISELLFAIHRMPDSRSTRPMAVVRMGGRSAAFRGGRRARA